MDFVSSQHGITQSFSKGLIHAGGTMKPLLISFLLFVPFALGARYYFVCQALSWCDRPTLAPQEGGDLLILLPDGRNAQLTYGSFPAGALTPARSVDQLATLDSLASFLAKFDDYQLVVRAPFHPKESDASGGYYRDMGLARAAELANELQRRGISGDRVELKSYKVKENAPVTLQLRFQPMSPDFDTQSIPRGQVLIDSTVLLGLRFETNSTALSPDEELAEYARDLVEALNGETSLSLKLIGHTDNRAETEFNDSLGLWKAQAVARYLQQLGYNREIVTETRGEHEPVADNNTPDGRYLNRRVEVRID